MPDSTATTWYHSNSYNAEAACEHCGGIIRHERWCSTRDPVVYYAYEIVAEPGKLSIGDSLILHALGVRWGANQCQGKCKTESNLAVAGPACGWLRLVGAALFHFAPARASSLP